MSAVRVALIGLQGYGAVHAAELAGLIDAGVARLVGAADVVGPVGETATLLSRSGARFAYDYRALFDSEPPEVVIVAAPPHLHHDMAVYAARSGSHVYLEKPPVCNLEQLASLQEALFANERICQVGFQSMGSGALERLREVAHGGSGCDLYASGHWRRDAGYWNRSRWAGKATLDGKPVGDGALTNPFAHAVMILLSTVGANDAADIESVICERYHANEIEVDDTSAVQVRRTDGRSFRIAVTLCAEQRTGPACVARTGGEEYKWAYLADDVQLIKRGDVATVETFSRKSLLLELLDAVRREESSLSCPLEGTAGFIALAAALSAVPVSPAPPDLVRTEGTGAAATRVIQGIDDLVEDAAQNGLHFSATDNRWAVPVLVTVDG